MQNGLPSSSGKKGKDHKRVVRKEAGAVKDYTEDSEVGVRILKRKSRGQED